MVAVAVGAWDSGVAPSVGIWDSLWNQCRSWASWRNWNLCSGKFILKLSRLLIGWQCHHSSTLYYRLEEIYNIWLKPAINMNYIHCPVSWSLSLWKNMVGYWLFCRYNEYTEKAKSFYSTTSSKKGKYQ